jgi:hypothetical protein
MKDTEQKSRYELNLLDTTLTFTTSSYKVEKSSVLHAGVYSKEFSSMLLASALCITIYMFTDITDSIIIRSVIFLFLFVIFFYGSREYVFYERRLKVEFDNDRGTVRITRPGIFFTKTEQIPAANIRNVEIGSRKFTPDNPDGVAFVEKISAQHGSYVPGLGEEEEFVTLSLMLSDGSERIIFAGHVEDEPEIPLNKIKSYLGIKGN